MSEYHNAQQVNGAREKVNVLETNVVHNQPYDESVEVSDGEEITSTNATPRGVPHPQVAGDGGYRYSVPGQEVGGGGGGGGGKVRYEEEDSPDEEEEEEEGSESEDSEDGPHATLSGAYDPAEFEHLAVSADLKELFHHISRYTPQIVELDTKLKPFVPEYIPAIGDIDAFLKVSRPDNKTESLGLTVLDEPRAKQSDPTVLDLQLRALTKQPTVKPVAVHSIADPEKQTKAMDNWIDSISELHRQKPATNVHYTKNMPDIETLMQEWPPQFEEALKQVGLPGAELDCDLAQFVDIICALLDIPVYKSRVHSLHMLFSLYMEFKNSQHFKSLASEQVVSDKPRSDSVIPEADV